MTEATEQIRTLQDVERGLEAVEVRIGELSVEAQDVEAALAAGTSDEKLLQAAMSGKSIAGTQRVRKLTDKRDEIGLMLRVLENQKLRLQLERVGLREVALEEALSAANEQVMEKREQEAEATARRQEAENVVGGMRDERYVLQDQRRNLENKLWANDPHYREEQEAEVEQRKAENEPTEEQQAQYREQINREVFGRVQYEDAAQLSEMQQEAARQGARLVPWNRGMRKVYSEED